MRLTSIAVPADESDLAQLVRQFGDAETALTSYLSKHSKDIAGQTGQADLLRSAQRQLLASEERQRTQRLVSEESMRESERRFRVLIEHSSDGMTLVDSSDTIAYVNPAVLAIEGYTHEDLIGRSGLEHVHPEDLPFMQGIITDLKNNPGKSRVMLWRQIHRSGQVLWLEGVATNLLNDPAVQSLVMNYRDVTERERMGKTRQQLAAIIESSDDAIISKTLDGIITTWNPGAEKIFGFRASDAIGKSMLICIPPELVTEETDILGHIAHGDHIDHYETVRLHQDGTRIEVSISDSPIRDDCGQIVGVSKIARDITPRKQSEADMLHNQTMQRMASRLGRIGPWSIEVPCLTLMWSDEVRAIHEVSTEFVLGMDSVFDFYPPGSRAAVRAALDACIHDGTPFDIEMQIVTAKWRHIWIRAMGEAVRDENGTIRRVQGAYQDISERKQVAEECRHVAERLTNTLESITDSFYTLDREWRFTYVNHQAENVFKRLKPELLGKIIWEVFPQIADTSIYHEFVRSITDNVTVHFEVFSATFNAWLDLRTYPSAQGLAVYFRDSSEQHKAQYNLVISEERFRLLAKATNDAIWDFNVATDQVSWNDGFETLFGSPRSQVETTIESWTSRIHPDDHARVIDKMQKAIEHGDNSWSDEFRIRHQNGRYSFILNRCHILRMDDGRPARIIGGMTDLTASKRAEQRIAEQAALLDKARDAISVRDLTNHITYWNKSAERLYGWTAAEIAGQSARDVMYKDAAEFDKAVQETIDHGEWTGELSPISRDGRHLLIDSRLTLVRDAAGMPLSILSICTDITERRKLEQQYLRAQRLESIGTLAGGIAHDLNNVLGPIMLSITLLTKDEKDEKRLGILSIIESSTRRGADMVRQVLSFARGVEGHRLPVQIPNLLREIETIINDTFLKNIQVITTFCPDAWMVSGDSTQLHQVLLNLCVNARDAMPDGGVLTLTVDNVTLDEHYSSQHIEAKPGPYVVIGVEDTGTGIPKDIIDKIFEPFFTTKDVGKGTGLGLSVSLAVVKSHKGFMGVYSEVGKGTAFKLYLPAITSAAGVSIIAEEPTLPLGHGELILVIDDEYSVRQITRQTLEAFGYRVLLASDGSEAVALFAVQQNDISLVITDMMMPIMDGNATIRVLNKIRPGLRIIAASGLNENHVVAKAMSNGVKHFLAKPYTAESLLTKIREALN
jgi:PAS domain S-box-containing protein